MKALLLVSKSRESRNKAAQLQQAGRELGIHCEISTSYAAGYDIEIPCSDSMVGHTRFGKSLEWLGSKVETARVLTELGIPSVKTVEVQTLQDILSCDIEGPIFVKSDRSSGSVAPHPYGYKRFDSVRHFYEVARHSDFDAGGYRDQFGSYVIQPYVPNEGVHTISFVKSTPLAPSFLSVDSDCFYHYLHLHPDHDHGQGQQIQALADFVNVPFLYVQGLMVDGKFAPVDVNVRLSTYLDSLMTSEGLDFYIDCWRVLLGEKLSFKTPIGLIGRIKTDWSRPSYTTGDPTRAKLLNFGHNRGTMKFDAAYSWPTYVIKGLDAMEKRDAFLKTVAIQQ